MVIRYVMAEYPHETCMEEDADGNYVLHSDYAALEARVAEMEKGAARLNVLHNAICKLHDSMEEYSFEDGAGVGFMLDDWHEFTDAVNEELEREA